MAYLMMKKIIETGGYSRADVMEKLDVFLITDRLTMEQYNELVALVG